MQDYLLGPIRPGADTIRAIPLRREKPALLKDRVGYPAFTIEQVSTRYVEVSPGHVVRVDRLTNEEIDIFLQDMLLVCVANPTKRTLKYESLTGRIGVWDIWSKWWVLLELDSLIGNRTDVSLFVVNPDQ